eukprot:6179226-Pleurochrysis_carterae.AAC.2
MFMCVPSQLSAYLPTGLPMAYLLANVLTYILGTLPAHLHAYLPPSPYLSTHASRPSLACIRSSQGVEVLVAPCANSSDVIEACSPNLVEASSASFVEDEPVGVPDLEAASSSAAESSSVMSSSMRQLDV